MKTFKQFCESKIFMENDLEYYAQVSDEALDNAYHYGRSTIKGTFGYEANKASAEYALKLLNQGITDIEQLSDAIHKGWASIATTFDDPIYQKKPDKKEDRLKDANTPYSNLPEYKKEIDRVAARALLAAYNAKQNTP